jgi:F-type H+-transporting ATPase subunit b
MRPGWLIGLFALVLLALLLAPCSAAADNEHPKGGPVEQMEKGASKDVEHKGDDPFGWAMDLAIWTIVVFLILLAILWRYAWGPLLQGLEKREHDIHSAHEEARKAKEEAQALRQKLQEEAQSAQAEVRKLIEQARRDGERLHAEMTAKAQADIQNERERLQREVATMRDQAEQHLFAQAAQLATLVSAKFLRRQISPDEHRHLVDDAVAEIRRAAEKDGQNGRSSRHG